MLRGCSDKMARRKKGLPHGRVLLCVLCFSCIFLSAGALHATQNVTPLSSFLNSALVTGVRHWTNTGYTRVVIDLDREVTYDHNILKEDVTLGKPPRVYVDLKLARLSPQMSQEVLIRDGLLTMARVAQYTPAIVRIVLDLESLCDYKVFSLNEPFRIVVDVLGDPRKKRTKLPETPPVSKPSLFTVVLDPGHGGEDPGAIGPRGLKEKDVVLKIALKLRDKINKELGWNVVMTRKDDRFIPLEERTAIANTHSGDLFVSIHANASRKTTVYGIESYILSPTTDEDALRLAARENGVSPEKISDLQLILYDLMLNNKVNESSELAEHVQHAIVSTLRQGYPKIQDLGVKQAPFVVLVGAKMPSILVEVSFISNRLEEKRLRSSKYIDELATGIMDGLKRYAKKVKLVKRYPSERVSTARSSN